jgi:hypothetical protein
MKHNIVVNGDHFQLLMGDSKHGPMIDTTHLWDTASGVAQLPKHPELVGIPTVRYGGPITIDIEVTAAPTNDEVTGVDWESIGEFSLRVDSGEIIFWGPELEDLAAAPCVACQPGTYAGIVFVAGSAEIIDEMVSDGPDRYFIRMFKQS